MLFCKFKKPVLVAATALLWLAVQTPVKAFELLTAEEIAAVSVEEYIERSSPHPQGPRIQVRQPDPPTNVRNPFDIEIRFSPQGNAIINLDTLEIRYGWIDVTQRVLESGQAEFDLQGIKVRGAEIKKGTYRFTISIEDSQGRKGLTQVRLVVL